MKPSLSLVRLRAEELESRDTPATLGLDSATGILTFVLDPGASASVTSTGSTCTFDAGAGNTVTSDAAATANGFAGGGQSSTGDKNAPTPVRRLVVVGGAGSESVTFTTPNGFGGLTVESSVELVRILDNFANGDAVFFGPVVVRSTGFGSVLTLGGDIDFRSTVALENAAFVVVDFGIMRGPVAGDGSIQKRGPSSTFTIAGPTSYSGTTNVTEGTLRFNGTSGALVENTNGGTLTGVGTISTYTSTGGTLAPGDGPRRVGTLRAGPVRDGTYTFAVNLAGTGEGEYSRLVSSADITLGAATLAVSLVDGYSPAAGDTFTIMEGRSLAGTFAGLAENAVIVAGGRLFRINYSTTAVTLTVSGDPAASGPGRPTLFGGQPDGFADSYPAGTYPPPGGTRVPFFPGSATAVRVAVGDVTGDGVPDYVGGTGAGVRGEVVVIDGGTGVQIGRYPVFEDGFTGGIYVAVGDLTGDARAEIVVGAGDTGGPRVVVLDGPSGRTLASFFAYATAFRGGVEVSVGDVNGDGAAEIVTGAGIGGAPHVRAFRFGDLVDVLSFFAFDPGLREGVRVAVGSGVIYAGRGPGGRPELTAFDAARLTPVRTLFPFEDSYRGGIRLSILGRSVAVGADIGGGPRARIYDSAGSETNDFFAFDSTTRGGVYIG